MNITFDKDKIISYLKSRRYMLDDILDDPEIKRNLDERNFDRVYAKVSSSNLMALLLISGIDPLDYLTTVPHGFIYMIPGILTIDIPQNIKSLDNGAFSRGVSLESIKLPNTIERIPDGAFESCTNLEEIILPDSIKEIGEVAFASCYDLREIQLPDHLEIISEYAFHGCELTSLTLPQSVIFIGLRAFEGTPMTVLAYRGTKDQFTKNIFAHKRDFLVGSKVTRIQCIDGAIIP